MSSHGEFLKHEARTLANDVTLAFRPSEWMAAWNRLRGMNLQAFRRVIKTMLPIFLCYYVALSPPVAGGLYDAMLFHPTKSGDFDLKTVGGLPVENLQIESGKDKIHAWLVRNPKSTRVVLMSHGNGGNLSDRVPLMEMFIADGASVLNYDYRGYGRSTGSASIANLRADGEAAYQELKRLGFKDSDIIAFGESIGTGIATDIAANHRVGAVILQSPYSSLSAIGKQKLLWLNLYPDWLFADRQLDNVKNLEKNKAPVLIVHGKQDRLVPFSHSEEITRRVQYPMAFAQLPNAGHNDIYVVDHGQYVSALRNFMASL